MAKGEIEIDQQYCKGCGYCVEACNRECIRLSDSASNALGYQPAEFTPNARCNACGVCAWTCPSLAIRVFRVLG